MDGYTFKVEGRQVAGVHIFCSSANANMPSLQLTHVSLEFLKDEYHNGHVPWLYKRKARL